MKSRIGLAALTLGIALAALPVHSQEELADGKVTNQVWGVHFAAPGYEIWDDHPHRGRPDLLAAGSWERASCGVNLSLFATLVESGTTPAECRRRYAAATERLEGIPEVTVLAVEDAPVAWTRFERKREEGVQSQLYGYLVRGETCLELHVSALDCQGFAGIATPVLESLVFEPPPEVNLETVAMAVIRRLEPDHWQVHLALAGLHLHNQPPNPARARRYYQNVLRLSRGDASFDEAWAVHEGIGLTWLDEDDGTSAIAPLSKAVELVRGDASASTKLEESLYNLACAYSLAGEMESACRTAGQLVDGLSGKQRRRQLKNMRGDPQLRALREAGCIKGF